MIRAQIQIDKETYDEIRSIAFKERKSLSEIIRRMIKKSLKKSIPSKRKITFTFIGTGNSKHGSLSEKHDDILKEDFL